MYIIIHHIIISNNYNLILESMIYCLWLKQDSHQTLHTIRLSFFNIRIFLIQSTSLSYWLNSYVHNYFIAVFHWCVKCFQKNCKLWGQAKRLKCLKMLSKYKWSSQNVQIISDAQTCHGQETLDSFNIIMSVRVSSSSENECNYWWCVCKTISVN